MKTSPLTRNGFLGAALLGAFVWFSTGCASAPSGPVPPTVAVRINSIPTGASVTVNGVRIGDTPKVANLEVDDTGVLAYAVTISTDYSSTGMGSSSLSGRSSGTHDASLQGGSLTWPAGKLPPATVTFTNGSSNESREYATRNPEGTRPSAGRM